MEKFCHGCNQIKNHSDFYKCKAKKDGLNPRCKECNKLHRKMKGELNKEKNKNIEDVFFIKKCSICREEKDNKLFNKDATSKDGYQDKCRSCSKQIFKNYYGKKCIDCGERKSLDSFRENRKSCKKCSSKKYYEKMVKNTNYKEKKSIKGKKYRFDNKEKISAANKKYYHDNKEKISAKNKEYSQKNKYKKKEYAKNYKDRRNEIRRNKTKTDPLYKYTAIARAMVNYSLKNKGFKKNTKTEKILGCTFEQFRIHLESKFEPWMNFHNHGKYNGEYNYGWDVDHIIPLETAKTEEEIIKLNHYTNLQPLCSKINRDIKKASI